MKSARDQRVATDIPEAADLLRQGELVIFPTETVYGLGADASNENAVAAVFRAKNRPLTHPLIIHIGDKNALADWADDISREARALAEAFWPGPLTLVLKKKSHVSPLITGRQETVALRMPNHPTALALLNTFGGGMVGPSANQFTHLSPTSTRAIDPVLIRQVAMVLEGGACSVGLESTIVDVSDDKPCILRPGMISAEAVGKILKMPVDMRKKERIRAPGMHALHYAPKTKTRLISSLVLDDNIMDKHSILLHHTDLQEKSGSIHYKQMPQEATAYARVLYQSLCDVDALGYEQILIEAVPSTPEWEAIRDRLRKASAS